jgi:hypothetical protein
MDGGKVGFRPVPIEADVRLEGLALLADPSSAALEDGIEFSFGCSTDCS